MNAQSNILDVLDDQVIGVKDFMKLIGVKSQTTFNKYVKNGSLPPPMEWPPGTSLRGWYLSVAADHVNKMMAEAAEKGWQNPDQDTHAT